MSIEIYIISLKSTITDCPQRFQNAEKLEYKKHCDCKPQAKLHFHIELSKLDLMHSQEAKKVQYKDGIMFACKNGKQKQNQGYVQYYVHYFSTKFTII